MPEIILFFYLRSLARPGSYYDLESRITILNNDAEL